MGPAPAFAAVTGEAEETGRSGMLLQTRSGCRFAALGHVGTASAIRPIRLIRPIGPISCDHMALRGHIYPPLHVGFSFYACFGHGIIDST